MFLHSQSNECTPRSCSSWSMACRSSLALPSSTRRRISLMTLRRRLWNMLSLPGRQRAPQARSRASTAGPPASPNTHSVQSWKTELLPRISLYCIGGASWSITKGDLGGLLDLCNRGLVSQFGHGFLGGPVLLHRQFLGRDHVDQGALYPRRKPPVLLAVKQRVRPERVARELLAQDHGVLQ